MKMILEQRQMLKMVMTTELRQAIELLQLSTYDLLQFIEQQAEENPLIELVAKEEGLSDYIQSRPKTNDDDIDPLDFIVDNRESLADHLMQQVNLVELDEELQKIVHYLILNLDESGYLTIEMTDVCHLLNISEEKYIEAKAIINHLEPIGVGAHSVADCLTIQARYKYPENTILEQITSEFLPLLADKKWQQIANQLAIELKDVNDAFELIQTLNPKPGSEFSSNEVDYITPDIIVEYDENTNEFSVLLNQFYIPDIKYNETYASSLQQSTEVTNYINEQYKNFQWLKKSIEQRRVTILKIMQVIINNQTEFLLKGFRYLKPLTLKDVANEIDMHESTVSRATANKIIVTPAGTFELRHLFSTKLKAESGEDKSQTEVKTLIKDIIENEDKYKPLSDAKIVTMLKDKFGVVISRRTVAKYRDEMNILSSSKRKAIKI